MYRLLLLTLAGVLMALGSSVGLPTAGAEQAADAQRLAPAGTRGAAAVELPAAPPGHDAESGAWGYVSAARLAESLGDGSTDAAAPAQPAGGPSATVVVTAVVLPVRTIVVDDAGRVLSIWSNTEDLDPRNSLYSVRRGSLNGPAAALDDDVWAQAAGLLVRANAASGRIA